MKLYITFPLLSTYKYSFKNKWIGLLIKNTIPKHFDKNIFDFQLHTKKLSSCNPHFYATQCKDKGGRKFEFVTKRFCQVNVVSWPLFKRPAVFAQHTISVKLSSKYCYFYHYHLIIIISIANFADIASFLNKTCLLSLFHKWTEINTGF